MRKTYTVFRTYMDQNIPNETVREGLTLQEAQEHCEWDETCSDTAESPEAIERTEKYGRWFEAFVGE